MFKNSKYQKLNTKIHLKCFNSRRAFNDFKLYYVIATSVTRIQLCNLQHGNFMEKPRYILVDHGQQIWFLIVTWLETLYMYFMYELHNHHYCITKIFKKKNY